MLSSAAIAAAAQGLLERSEYHGQYDIQDLVGRLQILTRVENECLHDCIQQIENTFQAAAENINNQMQISPVKTPSKSTPSQSVVINNNQINNQNNTSLDTQQPETSHPKSHTPTEVFDVSERYVA
jgi:hypothetical protein